MKITLDLITEAVRKQFAMMPEDKRVFPFETADVYINEEGESSEYEISRVVARTMIVGLSSFFGIPKEDVIEVLCCDDEQYSEYLKNYLNRRDNSMLPIRPRHKKDIVHGRRYQVENDARFNIKHILCENYLRMKVRENNSSKYKDFKNIIRH